jgi:hypothetical protein
MRMLAILLVVAFTASPALAYEAGGKPVFDPGADFNKLLSSLTQPSGPVVRNSLAFDPRKVRRAKVAQAVPARQGACPKCATTEMPSFAIRSAGESGQTTGAGGTSAAVTATDLPSTAASQPPINFSFSGTSDGSRSNRYNAGVRVGTSF